MRKFRVDKSGKIHLLENIKKAWFVMKSQGYKAQIKNLEKAWFARKRVNKITLPCSNCGLPITRYPATFSKNNLHFCSKKCFYLAKPDLKKLIGQTISEKVKGKKVSDKTKNKLKKYKAEKSSNWKGGKPICKKCGKQIGYSSTYCKNHKHLLWTKEHWESARNGAKQKLTGRLPLNIQRPGKFGNTKREIYDINGRKMLFRSKWEANYALYLDFLVAQKQIKKWEYETDVFIFDKIKFGTRSYRPDFKLFNNDDSIEYREVKGWMTPKSKTQLKRMKLYHPQVKVVLVERDSYYDIKNKVGSMLGFY